MDPAASFPLQQPSSSFALSLSNIVSSASPYKVLPLVVVLLLLMPHSISLALAAFQSIAGVWKLGVRTNKKPAAEFQRISHEALKFAGIRHGIGSRTGGWDGSAQVRQLSICGGFMKGGRKLALVDLYTICYCGTICVKFPLDSDGGF